MSLLANQNTHMNENKSEVILIVEDSSSERTLLKSRIEKYGYKTAEAKNGVQAWDFLKLQEKSESPVSIVISDWRMPKMDGVSLCKFAKEKLNHPPYFMILTSRNTPVDLVSAMDSGADDYLGKPFNSEELRVRILAGLRLNALNAEMALKNRALELSLAKQQAMNSEILHGISAAIKLQESTLPSQFEMINEIALAHYFKPALGIAGDTYSMFPIGDKNVGFYQIDVAGHGTRSAMLSYAISRHILELSHRFNQGDVKTDLLDPAAVMTELNTEFACDETCVDYFTAFYGVINRRQNSLIFCQAGHPYPFILKKRSTIERLGSGGAPVGLFPKSNYYNEQCEFNYGDKLVVYSDGIWECHLSNNQKVSEATLIQILEGLGEMPIKALQEQLPATMKKIVGYERPIDDLSFCILGCSNEQ